MDVHDPNEMVDIPDDIDLVDYDEEDPEEDPEEEPEEDVDIELEDDVELIFPYEVEGDKTATWTMVYMILRAYLSMEAELGTCQTEFALLKSKNKIGEKTRELLNHDLENVERALGNVLERMSILESGENATLKKILAKTETKLVLAQYGMFYLDMVRIGAVSKPPSDDEDTERPRKKSKNSTSDGTKGPSKPRRPPIELVYWSCIALDSDMVMPPKAMSEARMRKVIKEQVAASMAAFMANMNRRAGGDEAGGAGAGGAGAGGAGAGGAGAGGVGVGSVGPAAPEITGCTYITFMKCNPQPFKGTEGAVGLCQWSLLGLGVEWKDCFMVLMPANGTPWMRMVEPEQVKVEQYIRGLSKNIRGDVTSSRPAGINEAVRMAYQLMGQIIQDKTDEANAGAMTNAAPNDNEVCPKCKNKKHAGDCWKCGKCGKLGHKTAACWSLDRKDVTCFNCNEKGHRKRDCPKLKKNGQGGNNRGAVYKLGAVDA
ncbi:putative reverse transcriptase domain-containing protein [Tanacetum coccineum]